MDGRGKSERELLKENLIQPALAAMGVGDVDFQALSGQGSNAAVCGAAVKIYTGIDKLQPSFQAPFARRVLTVED